MRRTKYRNITLEEFRKIKSGCMIYCSLQGNIVKNKALCDAYYNADCDEPDWEVETSDGIYHWDSVYVKVSKLSKTEIYKTLKTMSWQVACKLSIPYRVMTVQISFSHKENGCDETEFDIRAWDSRELTELFTDFCDENHYTAVQILGIYIVNTAASFDELEEK